MYSFTVFFPGKFNGTSSSIWIPAVRCLYFPIYSKVSTIRVWVLHPDWYTIQQSSGQKAWRWYFKLIIYTHDYTEPMLYPEMIITMIVLLLTSDFQKKHVNSLRMWQYYMAARCCESIGTAWLFCTNIGITLTNLFDQSSPCFFSYGDHVCGTIKKELE